MPGDFACSRKVGRRCFWGSRTTQMHLINGELPLDASMNGNLHFWPVHRAFVAPLYFGTVKTISEKPHGQKLQPHVSTPSIFLCCFWTARQYLQCMHFANGMAMHCRQHNHGADGSHVCVREVPVDRAMTIAQPVRQHGHDSSCMFKSWRLEQYMLCMYRRCTAPAEVPGRCCEAIGPRAKS